MIPNYKKIKVLHLGFTDAKNSGSSLAMLRIHNGIKNQKIFSKIKVVKKKTNLRDIEEFNNLDRKINFIKRLLALFLKKFQNLNEINIHRSYNIFDNVKLVNLINNSKFNIVHLHWIHGEMLSLEDLSRIKKPVVWTLHDSWLVNSNIHVNIKNQKKIFKQKFLDKYFLERKKKILKNKNFTFVVPSIHMYNLFKKKFNLKNIFLIPHETSKNFKPIKKFSLQKKYLSSPQERKIMFFSYSKDDSYVKGNDLFIKLLQNLSQDDVNYHIYLCGKKNSELFRKFKNIKFTFMGNLNEKRLNILYNSVDLLVSCSRFESYGQTTLEARNAGLPVISFDVGAISERKNQEYIKIIKNYNVIKMSNEIKKYFNNNKKFKYKYIPDTNYIKIRNYKYIYLRILN